jgi:hypothetical protein
VNRGAREQLLRLRQLLTEAQERAHDVSSLGRHVAVVLLDGACEIAMRLICADANIHVKETASFYELRSRLAEGFPGWRQDGWADVSTMHAARNLAQHRAVTPDAADVSRWSAAVERFVRDLISTHFNQDLREILLASAVEEPELRTLLEAAEEDLEQGNAQESLQQTVLAFDLVRAKWRDQRATAVDPIVLYRSPLGVGMQDAGTTALAQLADYAEVMPFVQSLGEYIWFVARRDDLGREMPPTLEEARRGLRFVVDWVLRWEAFAATYVGRRYPPPKKHALPKTNTGDPPIIIGAEVERREEPGIGGISTRYGVAMQIANLPDEDLHTFIGFFQTALAALPAGQLERSGDPTHGSLNYDGVVRFWGVETDTVPEALVARVRHALSAADAQYRDLLRRRTEWRDVSREILAAWEGELRTVTFGGRPLFEEITIEGIVDEHGRPAYTVTAVAPLMSQDEVGVLVWEVLNAAGISIGTEVSYHGPEWRFASSLDARSAASKAQEVASLMEEKLAEQRRNRARLDAATQAFREQLDAALGDDVRGRRIP